MPFGATINCVHLLGMMFVVYQPISEAGVIQILDLLNAIETRS